MAQKTPDDPNAGKTLEELRAQALSENEHTTFSGAYLEHEDIEGIGVKPTINAVLANFAFIDTIDAAPKGGYMYSVGANGSLTVSISDTNGTLFYVNHTYEPISLFPQVQDPNVDWLRDDLFSNAVKNCYETTTGYRPSYEKMMSQEDGMLLIRLYDDMGDHLSTAGRFLIDPGTM